MTKADELWEKYVSNAFLNRPVRKEVKIHFLAALAEYGQAVRDRDAEICRQQPDEFQTPDQRLECAAAISREPMP